jgi:hypothetical protein
VELNGFPLAPHAVLLVLVIARLRLTIRYESKLGYDLERVIAELKLTIKYESIAQLRLTIKYEMQVI